jgi:serine/threonine protein kinase
LYALEDDWECPSDSPSVWGLAQFDVPFPSDRFPVVDNLVLSLLEEDPAKRFGFEQITKHPFFENLDFEQVLAKPVRPDYVPPKRDEMDLTNFDAEFTRNKSVSSFDCPVFGSVGHVQGFSFEADFVGLGQSTI